MKTTRLISIDSDVNELAKIKRMEDPDFNISSVINDFLRDLFKEDVSNLNERKVKANISRLERELALEKQKVGTIKREEERIEKEREKKYGVIVDPDKL